MFIYRFDVKTNKFVKNIMVKMLIMVSSIVVDL